MELINTLIYLFLFRLNLINDNSLNELDVIGNQKNYDYIRLTNNVKDPLILSRNDERIYIRLNGSINGRYNKQIGEIYFTTSHMQSVTRTYYADDNRMKRFTLGLGFYDVTINDEMTHLIEFENGRNVSHRYFQSPRASIKANRGGDPVLEIRVNYRSTYSRRNDSNTITVNIKENGQGTWRYRGGCRASVHGKACGATNEGEGTVDVSW